MDEKVLEKYANIKVDAVDKGGRTARWYATMNGDLRIETLLMFM